MHLPIVLSPLKLNEDAFYALGLENRSWAFRLCSKLFACVKNMRVRT